MPRSQEITLLITSDRRFVPLAATLLRSIRRHVPAETALSVHWFSHDVEPATVERFSRFADVDLKPCTMNVTGLATLPTPLQGELSRIVDDNDSSWGPAAVFAAPFLLPRLVPRSVSRAIFLDVDIIALGDISELATMSLDGHAVAAVRAPLRRFSGRLGTQVYLNSGVLVIDLEKWRRDRVSERCLDYLRRIEGDWSDAYPDQDALNVVLKEDDGRPKWKALEPKWNACTPLFVGPRESILYDPVPIEDAVLIHYSGTKPWVKAPASRLARFAQRLGIRAGRWAPVHPHASLFYDELAAVPFALDPRFH